jgi:hypothetical protein
MTLLSETVLFPENAAKIAFRLSLVILHGYENAAKLEPAETA